jgi:hypothetical protein
MSIHYRILIMGASYGSLFATKLALAGHDAHMTCRSATADLIRREGTIVRFPVKGRPEPVSVSSLGLKGRITGSVPQAVDPSEFDLVVLAMQEPQYAQDGVRQLLQKVAAARVPCVSIMNMPPPPYLARIPGIDVDALRDCFTNPDLWQGFEPGLVTLCSPDPQAVRPAGEGANVLQVRLPTNFKAARFESDAHTAMLQQIEHDIEAARFEIDGTEIELPVKLKVSDSLFVPLAKWPMLLTGNYRCVGEADVRPIRDAVHADMAGSKHAYDRIAALCQELGASAEDLVPFEKYAAAAASLANPSSVARALVSGAQDIERVDKLVERLFTLRGETNAQVTDTVCRVDGWLARNRTAQVAAA